MKARFSYKWVIAGSCFLMIFTCLGFCSSNFGLYLSGITSAWNFPRSLYSLTSSIRFITNSIVSLFFGSILHRFGIKKSLAFGFATAVAALLVNATAKTLAGFYFGGMLLGLGLSFSGTAMTGTIIRQWFPENIGKITGIVLASNGLGGALAAQIITPLIFDESNPLGYRKAYLISAAIVTAVAILLLILIRDNKASNTPSVPSKKAQKKNAIIWTGIAYTTLKKKTYFYTTILCVFLTGLIIQTVATIRSVYLKDNGFDPGIIGTIASFSSLLLSGAKFSVGLMYDKCGLRTTLLICQLSAAAAMLMLLFVDTSPLGMGLTYGSVILMSIATPMQTIGIPLVCSDLFGTASYEKLLGILVAANTAGYALGSPIANLVFDTLGTYVPIFWVFSGLILFVAALYTYNIRSAYKIRQQIMQESNS